MSRSESNPEKTPGEKNSIAVFPTSIENIITALAPGREYRNEVMSILKARARNSTGGFSENLKMLYDLADEIFPEEKSGIPRQAGQTLPEALQYIANEAGVGNSPDYRVLLTRFLRNLDLYPAVNIPEKNPMTVPKNESPKETSSNLNSEEIPDSDLSQQSPSAAEFSENSTGSEHPEPRARGQTNSFAGVEQTRPAKERTGNYPDSQDPFDDYAGPPLSYVQTGSNGRTGPGFTSDELMQLPGLLPPPPKGGDGAMHGTWLEGDINDSLSFNIKPAFGETEIMDRMIEMLSEFFALPEAACQTHGARIPVQKEDERKAGLDLIMAARDLGFQGHTIEKTADLFFQAVSRYFKTCEPIHADMLTRAGFEIKLGSGLAVILASALDIEAFFLQTGPENADQGQVHDVRGVISPNCVLHMPHILDRALFMHFSSSSDISGSLKSSLAELRHAQFCRHLGHSIPADEFDSVFNQDLFIELTDFPFQTESTSISP